MKIGECLSRMHISIRSKQQTGHRREGANVSVKCKHSAIWHSYTWIKKLMKYTSCASYRKSNMEPLIRKYGDWFSERDDDFIWFLNQIYWLYSTVEWLQYLYAQFIDIITSDYKPMQMDFLAAFKYCHIDPIVKHRHLPLSTESFAFQKTGCLFSMRVVEFLRLKTVQFVNNVASLIVAKISRWARIRSDSTMNVTSPVLFRCSYKFFTICEVREILSVWLEASLILIIELKNELLVCVARSYYLF